MSNVTTAAKKTTGKPIDLYTLNSSLYMKDAVAEFVEEQKGTITQTYADDVNRMYEQVLLHSKLSRNRALLSVLKNVWQAHLVFVDVVDPERFDAELDTTVENEFMLTRNATAGGQVTLLIDEDLVTFSYLPEQRDKAREILTFHYPEKMDADAYWQLMRRFFEL